MKKQYHTLHSSRGAMMRSLLFALLPGSILLCSCADDLSSSTSSRQLTFTPTVSSSWNQATRSASEADVPQNMVTAVEGYVKPLYLHTYYTDSIATTSSMGNEAITRATPIKTSTMYESFGVSAYLYNTWDEKELMPLYFYDLTATKAGETYNLDQTYYWPGGANNMKFFAYAPKGDANYKFSEKNKVGSPLIDITIPSDVADQKDLLVAQRGEVKSNAYSTLPLTFNHALTAVRFVCGNDMQGGSVKSVSLKKVYSKGTFNYETNSWSNANAPADFSQTLNKSTTGSPDEALTTDVQTFMMIPQTLPDGAQIEVVFTDNAGIDHTLTADIKGTEWPIGKTVNYKISTSSINWTYTLAVTSPADFTYEGGTRQYDVTSYRQHTKGVKEAVAWTAQYSTDGGSSWTDCKPDWLTDFTASGAGGEISQSYNATVSAQIDEGIDLHAQKLKDSPARGDESRHYNLANQTNGGTVDENTANCYVVGAPGYYCFPLVYGNAIKNGASNTSAYTSKKTGSDILKKFINHTGNPITSPYIKENAGCAPAKAELVWQDAPNLVSNIQFNNTGNGNISFKVDKSNIRQGNAVIAIKDASGAILWSWHIWVTDENIGQTIEVTNHQSKKYKFMPVNLGWCDGRTETYAERSCKVRFTAGDASKEVIIKQVSASITTGGNHPYYQWGRKDPFLPSNGLYNTNKTWYDKDGNAHKGNPKMEYFSKGTTCIMNYILKPDVVQKNMSGDYTYANLWSADNNVYTANDENVIKTIYDPSPVGFKLPPSNAFTGFTTTGKGVWNDLSKINGTWDSSLKGWNFYTDSSKKKTISFPASGCRESVSGVLDRVGHYGYYWSAVPYFQYYGRYLRFDSWEVYPLVGIDRAAGQGVRSSQE